MRVQTILKESEGEKLLLFCKKNYISVSALLRSIICQHVDSFEQPGEDSDEE